MTSHEGDRGPLKPRRFGFRSDLHRPDTGENADRVGYMELFFDLAFVYAITAQAELLSHHLQVQTLVATVVIGVAIWWTWISTAWVTNWLDPNTWPVRSLLIALMAASLILSGTIGDALTERAPAFAITLVVVNIGRPLFAVFALRRTRPADAANFTNLSVWSLLSAPLWIVGAYSGNPLTWWVGAVVLDLLGPLTRFSVPGLGRTPLHTWRIRGAHLAERVSLFVLIALGEAIALIGENVAEIDGHPSRIASLAAAFAYTVLLWFLYFNHGESLGSEKIKDTDATGAIARNTYSYTAALLVIGIVLGAVATQVSFEQAVSTTTSTWAAGLLVGATIVCLAGNLLFRLSLQDAPIVSHLIAIVIAAAVFPLHAVIPTVVLEWAVVAILAVVVIADDVSARRSVRGKPVQTNEPAI